MRRLVPCALLLFASISAPTPAAQEQEAHALRHQARQLLGLAAVVALEAEPADRAKVLADIASVQWQAGDHEAATENFDLAQEALEIVHSDDHSGPSTPQPDTVALARVRAGDLEGARKALARIQDPKAKKRASENMAWGELRVAMTPEEVQAARALVDQDSADRLASMLVGNRAKQGDLEGARALAATIVDPKHRGPALLVLATSPAEIRAARALVDPRTADFHCSISAYRRAEEGEFEAARSFAEAVADPAKRAEVFESIASIEKRIRDKEAGRPPAVDESGFFYGRGAATCWLEVPATPELEAQGEAVIERALAGDFKGALEIVTQIQSRETQEDLLVGLAAFRAYKQDIKGAHATVERLRRKDCRGFALQYIAMFEIQAADLAGAAATIDAMPDSLTKGSALTQLAEAQIKAGEAEAALTTLESALRNVTGGEISLSFIPDYQQRAPAVGRVGLLQARAGEGARAKQTFAQAAELAIAGGEEEGTWTTSEKVASMHVEAGLIAEGIAFLQVAPVKNRLSLLRQLMRTAGRRNQVAESLAAAEGLTDPVEKANALVGLADGLLTRATYGPPAQ